MARTELKAPSAGSVWAHSAGVGQHVFAGNPVLILECMKMEMPVDAPIDGEIVEIAAVGTLVEAEQVVAVIEG